MNQSAYLEAMEITLWRQRQTLPGARVEQQVQAYLLNNQQEPCGIVFTIENEISVQLMMGILQATECEYQVLQDLTKLQTLKRLLVFGDWQPIAITEQLKLFSTLALTQIIKEPLRKREVWRVMQQFLGR